MREEEVAQEGKSRLRRGCRRLQYRDESVIDRFGQERERAKRKEER